jgi:hypothetical protein
VVTACSTPCSLVSTPLSPIPLITNLQPLWKKHYLTPRPFVSSSLSALRDLQSRIDHAIDDLPLDHHEMRSRIVDFERAHLDHKIFREVQSFSGSQLGDHSARSYLSPADPEQYFTV